MPTALPAIDPPRRAPCGAGSPAADALNPAQRNALVAAIAGAHLLLVWALLQVPAVRQAVLEAAPVFVHVIAQDDARAQAPLAPPAPPPPVRVAAKRAPAVVAAKAVPTAAAAFVVEAPPQEPQPPQPQAVDAPPAPPAPAAEPAPAPAAPKLIPASGVHYLVAPPLAYPRASRRMRESGKVLVRVYIDAQGLPREVLLDQSSGHARLDDAALAAVREARFKPYTEGGRPTPGWAAIPLTFDLER